jgi:hypothetical protein
LKSYGLIKINADRKFLLGTNTSPAYTCFSESFQSYLSDLGRTVELFPILGKTELALRALISKELQRKYKDLWLEELKKQYPKEFQIYSDIQIKDKKEER